MLASRHQEPHGKQTHATRRSIAGGSTQAAARPVHTAPHTGHAVNFEAAAASRVIRRPRDPSAAPGEVAADPHQHADQFLAHL